MVARLDDRRGAPALAFSIPRRVGTAVVRNRTRRRLREIFRQLERDDELRPGDYLVIVEPGAATLTFADLHAHVVAMNDRLGAS